MQSQLIRDFAKRQGTHGEIAVLKEVTLARNDRLCDTLNSQKPLLEIPHEPTRFLQVLRKKGGFAIASLAEVIRVLLIHPNTRIDRSIDAHAPALLILPDY